MKMTRSNRVLLLVVVMLLLLPGCSQLGQISSKKEEIYIYAAASLTESFQEIKLTYEAEHDDIEIIFNFAGSQILANQITEGATPAMFFAANTKFVDAISGNETIKSEDKTIFARNSLVILVNNQNENKPIKKFEDLFVLLENDLSSPSIVLAHDAVPVGAYTLHMLETYKALSDDEKGYHEFLDHVVSYENDVKAVLAKVTMNAADWGVVYISDAMTVKDKPCYIIDIPEVYNQTAEYGAIRLDHGENAKALYTYITQGEGQEILAAYGLSRR